jgi:hypothetical protein
MAQTSKDSGMNREDWIRLFWKLADAAVIVLALNCAYSAAQNWIYRAEGAELRRKLETDSKAVLKTHDEVGVLVSEAVQYSRRDPGILPVLRNHGIVPPPK